MEETTPKNIHKLPVILMVSCLLIIVAAVSVVGIIHMHNKYATFTESETAGSDLTISEPAGIDESNTSSLDNNSTITVSGDVPADEFDTVLYTKRLYELKELFAVDKFQSVSELSPSAVVQFAFCHLYYDSLVDMPVEKTMMFRQVLPDSISEEIKKLFGENSVDIKKSDLYNADKDVFEMWQPKLRQSVFADSTCKKVSDTSYEVTSTFYTDQSRTQVRYTVTGTFEKQANTIIILNMQTK